MMPTITSSCSDLILNEFSLSVATLSLTSDKLSELNTSYHQLLRKQKTGELTIEELLHFQDQLSQFPGDSSQYLELVKSTEALMICMLTDIQPIGSSGCFEYEGNQYFIRATRGQGSCGLHALLGEEIQGIYRFHGDDTASSANAKKYFTNSLNASLESSLRVQEVFCEVIVGHLSASDSSAKMLFEESYEGTEIKRRWQELNSKYDLIKDQLEGQESQEWIKIIASEEGACFLELRRFSEHNRRDLLKVINEQSDHYIDLLSETSKTAITALRDQKRNQFARLDEHKKELILQKKTIQHYFEVLNNPFFYLNTHELLLATIVFNLRAVVIVVTRNGYVEVAHRIPDPLPEGSTPIIVHHQGLHFSRCVPAGNASQHSDPELSFSEKINDAVRSQQGISKVTTDMFPVQSESSLRGENFPPFYYDRDTRSTVFSPGPMICRGFNRDKGEIELQFSSQQQYIDFHRRIAYTHAAYEHYGLAIRHQKDDKGIAFLSRLAKTLEKTADCIRGEKKEQWKASRYDAQAAEVKEKIKKEKKNYHDSISKMHKYLHGEHLSIELFLQYRAEAIQINSNAFLPHLLGLLLVPVLSKYIPEDALRLIDEAYQNSPQLTFNILMISLMFLNLSKKVRDNEGILPFYQMVLNKFPDDFVCHMLPNTEEMKGIAGITHNSGKENECRQAFVGHLEKALNSVQKGDMQLARDHFSAAEYYHISDKRAYMYKALIDLQNTDTYSALKLTRSLTRVIDWSNSQSQSRLISMIYNASTNLDSVQLESFRSLESQVLNALISFYSSPTTVHCNQYVEWMKTYLRGSPDHPDHRPDFVWACLAFDIVKNHLNTQDFLELSLIFIQVIYRNLSHVGGDLSEFEEFLNVENGQFYIKPTIIITEFLSEDKTNFFIDFDSLEMTHENPAAFLKRMLWNRYDLLMSFLIQGMNITSLITNKIEGNQLLYTPLINALIARMNLRGDFKECYQFFTWANDHAAIWPPLKKQAVTDLIIRWQLKTPVLDKMHRELLTLKKRWLQSSEEGNVSGSRGLYAAERVWSFIRNKQYPEAGKEIAPFFNDWENQLNEGIDITALHTLCAVRVLLAKPALIASMPVLAKSEIHSQLIQCGLSLLAREGVEPLCVIPDRDMNSTELEGLCRLYTGKKRNENDGDYFRRLESLKLSDTSDLRKVKVRLDIPHPNVGWMIPITRKTLFEQVKAFIENEIKIFQKFQTHQRQIQEEKPKYTSDEAFIRWVTDRTPLIEDYLKDKKSVLSDFARQFPKLKNLKEDFVKELETKAEHRKAFLELKQKMPKALDTEERFWQLIEQTESLIRAVHSGSRKDVNRDLILNNEEDARFVMELIYEWSRSQWHQPISVEFICSFHGPEIHIWGNGPRITHFNAGVFSNGHLENVHLFF